MVIHTLLALSDLYKPLNFLALHYMYNSFIGLYNTSYSMYNPVILEYASTHHRMMNFILTTISVSRPATIDDIM